MLLSDHFTITDSASEASRPDLRGTGLRWVNYCLFVLFLSFILVDPIRRTLSAESPRLNYVGLITTDIILLISVFFFRIARLPAVDNRVPRFFQQCPYPFKLLATFWIAWVIAEMFNPYYPSLLLSLAGAREYLLPSLAVVFGWFAATYWGPREWRVVFRIVLLAVVGLIAFSVIQYTLDSAAFDGVVQSLMTPAEHAVHTWEDDDSIKLVSSVFASSKRYGRFLLMVFPLLWIHLRINNKRRTRMLVVLLFALGCFASGSREALIMLAIMELLLEGISALLPKIMLVAAAAILLLPAFVESDLGDRIKFAFSTSEDWSDRVDYMTLGPLFRDLEGAEAGAYAFGFGAGRYGQSTQLLGEDVAVIDLRKAVGTGSIDDAGLYKILLDLGVVGLVIFLTFNLYVLYLSWPLRKRSRGNPLYRASGVAILTWHILFLKSHTTLSDVMIYFFFWFYLGMLIASRAPSRSSDVSYSRAAIPADPTVTVALT